MQRAVPLRADELHPGDLIAGKYRVRTILGRSHGLLVEAFHTDFDQRVVVRVLLPGSVDEHEIERFRREARTLAKLESEHVARIIDVGHQPDGSFYLVRQYLDGVDLATHLRSARRLALPEAVLFILQAAEAVAETHSHGIILRELQPSHMFLTSRAGGAPLVKIIDFGTAKLMRDAAAPGAGGELTATTMFGMSPYSSPELVRKAKNVDLRTDIWSLGACFYELLTGRPPFSGEMAALMLQITREEPVPASQLVRTVPTEVDAILGWCLTKDVDGRFANVHAFAHALSPYASPEGLVLIERIGQTTQAGKQRKKVASVPPPPIAHAPVEHEDSVTRVKSAAQLLQDVAPLERTVFMNEPPPKAPAKAVPAPRASPPVFAGAAASPAPYPQAAAQAVPALPPSRPGHPTVPPGGGLVAPSTVPPGQGLVAPSTVPPGGGLLGPSPQFDASRPASSWPGRDGATPPSAVLPSAAQTSHGPPSESSAQAILFRKITIGAIGAVAVFLPILVVILIVRARSIEAAGPITVAATESAAPLVVPPPVATQLPPAPEPTAGPTPAASATVAAAPTETAPPPAATAAAPAAAPPAAKTTTAAASPPPSTPSKPAQTTAPASTPPPAKTASGSAGGTGMLVAVAVGGTCTFSVNGASKGTTSTLKIPLNPGSYSVSCKPATGATKSRSVTIKSGETAMAMFKLQ